MAIISRNAIQSTINGSDTHLIERICDKPLNPELPITEDSFCFFYPYPPEDGPAGDLCLSGWSHGAPRSWREFILIVNGSIIKDGYTVECPTTDFYETLEVRDGYFVVSSARSGSADIFVTYENVTAKLNFIAFW